MEKIQRIKWDRHSCYLQPVTNSDAEFLFDLLNERDPLVNISHKNMPTYDQHTKFINSKPYSKWYIIYVRHNLNEFIGHGSKKITNLNYVTRKYVNKKVGSIYLSKNDEIGIFILKKFQNKNIGEHVLNLLIEKNPKKRYLANINPKNKNSINFFKKNKFRLIQYTFELNNKI